MAEESLRTSVAAELGSAAPLLRAVARTEAQVLPGGTILGEHFEIEALIGVGGMGAVYRARDLRLGRRVAIKLEREGTDLERLRREASALARLAHPNVVAIHEIIEHAGAVAVVMELCEGGSVRGWLAAAPRSQREILEVFLAAGRGLAAAHVAGLVHRDVKPDNLLRGADGRVRVADFGLAREAEPPCSPVASQGPLIEPGVPTTVTGAVLGTPRYMAPEQLRGGRAEARSDQFAFALALYEALAGVDPFPEPLDLRLAAIDARELAPPVRQVPRHVLAALRRALAPEPAARWPTLSALLEQLSRPAPRQKLRGLLVVALVVGATLAVVTGWRRARSRPSEPCPGLPQDLSAVWSPSARAAVVAGVAAPGAGRLGQRYAITLDHFAEGWARSRQRLCRELPHDPQWSVALAAGGRRCLLRNAAALEHAVALRHRAPGELVAVAIYLGDPAACGRPQELTAAGLEPLDARVEFDAAALEMLLHSGRSREALTRAQELLERLPTSASRGARGLVELLLGRVLSQRGELHEAAEHLHEAFFALRSSGDRRAFDAARALTDTLVRAGEGAAAQEWQAHARAEAAHLELTRESRASFELVASRVAELRGELVTALATSTHGLALVAGCERLTCLVARLELLASRAIYYGERQPALGLADAREAIASMMELYGIDYFGLITVLWTAGLAETELGQVQQAVATMTWARVLTEQHLPRQSLQHAYSMWNQSVALGHLDRRAARAGFDQALAIVEAQLGAASEDARALRADREQWSTAGGPR